MVDDPSNLRKIYFDAWHKFQTGSLLSPMEAIIVDIIQRHPEYHPMFSKLEHFEELKTEKFALDHNPFFHLALHVTIAEQVASNRPPGIKEIYQKLLNKHTDKTITEHKMIECLARILMDNFKNNITNNDERYIELLKGLL